MAKVITQNDLNDIIQSAVSIADASIALVSEVGNSISAAKIDINKKQLRSMSDSVTSVVDYLSSISNTLTSNDSLTNPNTLKLVGGGKDSPIVQLATSINESISKIMGTMAQLDKMKMGILTMIQLKIKIKMLVNIFISIIDSMSSIFEKKLDQKKVQQVNDISTMISGFIQSLESISKLKLNPLIVIKLKLLKALIPYIIGVVNVASQIDNTAAKEAQQKMQAVENVFKALQNTIKLILLMIPLMALFILMSPVIILFFWVTSLVIKVLSKLLNAQMLKDVVIGLVIMVAIVGVILILAAMLLVVALMAVQINSKWSEIFKMLFGIVGTVIVMGVVAGLLGALVAASSYVLVAIVVGLIAMVTIISIFFIIALELRLLQELKLDQGKIQKNIDTILDIAFGLIESIFNSLVKAGGSDKSEPWWKQLLGFLGGAIKTLLTAILSVVFLAYTFMAITIILLIAVTLRILQEINLDQNKIAENVGIVIDTALLVITSIFAPRENPEDSPSDKNWFVTVLQWIGGTIFKLISAILSVAFLAMTFVSMTLILLIATELRVLQEINLDQKKITDNVSLVIETAFLVINSIFGPKKTPDDNPSDKNWFIVVLEYVGGAIVKLISAILSVYFLAMTLVAMTLLLLIATELTAIQSIKLDANKIKQNVATIIDCAFCVINSIFNPENREDSPTEKSWVVVVFEWIGGTIFKLISAILSIAFLALIMVSIALLISIAKELEYLQTLELDAALIQENVWTVIDTAQMLITTIFDTPDDRSDSPSEKGFIRTVLEVLGMGPVLQIIDAIMSIAFLGLIYFSIYMVKLIAEQLNIIQKIKLNPTAVKKTVSTVIQTCHHVIGAVMQGHSVPERGAQGWLRKLLKKILPSGFLEMLDALMSMGFLAVSVSSIRMIGQLAEWLTVLLKVPNVGPAREKANDVIWASKQVINAVWSGGSHKEIEEYENKTKFNERYINSVQRTLTYLSNVVRSMHNFKALKSDSVKSIQKAALDIVGIVDSIQSNAKSDISIVNTRLNQLSRLNKIIRSLSGISDTRVERAKQITDNYTRFIDKIGSIKLENLQTTTNLFEKMAAFSNSINGNFEKLADSINEKLMPLLQELKSILEKIPTDVSVETKSQSNESTDKNINPNTDNAQSKSNMEITRALRDVYGKIDDFMDLFENGTAKVRI